MKNRNTRHQPKAKPKLALILLVSLVWRVGFAQAGIIDSLKTLLTIAQMDTSRVMIMMELGSQYKNIHSDSALYYGQKALVLIPQNQLSIWGILRPH